MEVVVKKAAKLAVYVVMMMRAKNENPKPSTADDQLRRKDFGLPIMD
jgi:hypothetical protein